MNSTNVYNSLEDDPDDPCWMILKWTGVPSVDPMVGAVLGNFVHNVRSALDQLMWVLVKLNGNEPGRHTQWPVAETDGQWPVDITDRVADRGPAPTDGISEAALRFVEQHQPFQLGKKARRDAPLNRLHRLSNVDKHRTLHAAVPFPSEMEGGPTLTPAGYYEITKTKPNPRPIPIQEGAVFMRLKIREVQPIPAGLQVTLTPPDVGLHVGFYADDKFVVAVDHLAPMLADARKAYDAALQLPEVAGVVGSE